LNGLLISLVVKLNGSKFVGEKFHFFEKMSRLSHFNWCEKSHFSLRNVKFHAHKLTLGKNIKMAKFVNDKDFIRGCKVVDLVPPNCYTKFNPPEKLLELKSGFKEV
jgi:hypothetical protein